MKTFDLQAMQKKGQAGVNSKISFLVGALIVIVLATSLAPTMFDNVANLSSNANTPEWVSGVLYVIIGAGLVFLIWRAFGNNK